MQKSVVILLSIALVMNSGCIERYYPDEKELNTGTLVVVAQLKSIPGNQSVFLSRSTTLRYPGYDPLSDCYVEILDSEGTMLEMIETRPGEYSGNLDEQFLRAGKAYCLNFVTPYGERYESGYETLNPSSAIDSLYYKKENHPTTDPDHTEKGVQFYVDFEINKDSGQFMRWQLIETYEIRNPEYPARIFDVDRQMKEMPDSISPRTCWVTLEVPEFFTLDLGTVEGDHYKQLPLNYISTETRRLNHRYSLLVRQMTLSRSAFWYWNELGKNIQSKGTLFDTQPSITPSNICNVNDEEELVIGYFSISGAFERRIYVENQPDLDAHLNPNYCFPGAYPPFLNRFRRQYLPVYLATAYKDGSNHTGEVNKECVDCREYRGSSNMPPEFW